MIQGRAKLTILAALLLAMFFASVAHGEELLRTEMLVDKLVCGSCLRVIKSELMKRPGVIGMTAVFRDRRVTVDHEQAVSAEEVAALISRLGYPATIVSSGGIAKSEAKVFQRRAGFGTGPGCCNIGDANPVADSWREMRRRLFRSGKGRRGQGPPDRP